MPFALQLFLDSASDAKVRRLWKRFAVEGLTCHLYESENRPHLTLAIYDRLNVPRGKQLLVEIAAELQPFPVTFVYTGVFTDPGTVVFLAPVVTRQLLAIHHMVHDSFSRVGESPNPYYLPGRWVPHCTVATKMDADALGSAMHIAQDVTLPFAATAAALGIVRVSPTTPLATVALGREP